VAAGSCRSWQGSRHIETSAVVSLWDTPRSSGIRTSSGTDLRHNNLALRPNREDPVAEQLIDHEQNHSHHHPMMCVSDLRTVKTQYVSIYLRRLQISHHTSQDLAWKQTPCQIDGLKTTSCLYSPWNIRIWLWLFWLFSRTLEIAFKK